jgi:hypothetical protein
LSSSGCPLRFQSPPACFTSIPSKLVQGMRPSMRSRSRAKSSPPVG